VRWYCLWPTFYGIKIINNEFKKTRGRNIFNKLFQHFPGLTEENHEKPMNANHSNTTLCISKTLLQQTV
jgi:hypothetical protein